MDEGLYLNIMLLMADYDIFNQEKLVYKLNIFGSLIGIIFDTVSTYAYNSQKNFFIEIRIKINSKKLKISTKGTSTFVRSEERRCLKFFKLI